MDLNAPGVASLLADTIRTELDNQSAADNPAKHSWRVSPSKLGDECVARQWYKFRWAKLKPIEGRMARLFKRGHKEEGKLTALLRATGWTIDDVDPERAHTDFPQYRIKKFGGHMSGYLDGKGSHPVHTGGARVLLEYKTYNTKRFSHLYNKKSVQVADYEYYCQVVVYLKEHDLPWCLFIATNKNDDDIYIEAIQRNDALAEHLDKTAHTIIYSKARPGRLAESPAFHGCKFCDFIDVCHHKAPVDISCRSCQHCTAIDGGNFHCDKWSANIPNEAAIRAACPSHLPIV